MLRAFQGIGGAGVYAVTMVLVSEITPIKHIGIVLGFVNVVFIVASAIGPLVGGAISSGTTWRWCFWLNGVGFLVIALVVTVFPKTKAEAKQGFRKSVLRVDWLGLILLLAAAILVIIPLQEGGTDLAWDSGTIIALFVVGGFCWIAFGSWQTWLAFSAEDSGVLPMLPVRIARHRIIGTCIL